MALELDLRDLKRTVDQAEAVTLTPAHDVAPLLRYVGSRVGA